MSFNNLVNLASLVLKQNPDKEEVEYWPRLQFLEANSNKIKELGKIGAPKLRHLDLSKNTIEKFTEDFDGHPSIQFLDLSMNSLTDARRLANFPSLKTLYLGNNKIHRFAGFEGCPQLEYLHLRGNVVSLS